MPSTTTADVPAADTPLRIDPASPSARQLFFRLFPSIMLPMFLAAIDQTIVATALPAIAGSLGEVERVSWVVVSYLVASTIAAPVYGRLGDALGRRRMLLTAMCIFIAASVFCAVATSIVMLTVARVLQGLGGGGLMTLTNALVGQTVPPRERGRYQGYLASVFVVASTFGPVAGGWLTQNFGWQSVFLINLPLGALALVMVYRMRTTETGVGRFHFDFIGVVLFALFIAPLLLALEQAQRFSLRSLPPVLLLLGVAALSLVLLLRQERRAAAPLLPIALLRQSAIWRTDAMAVCVGATLVSMVTFIPIYLRVVRGTGPSDTGKTAVFPSFGLPIVCLSLVTLALFAPQLSLVQLPFLFALIAMSNGTAMPVVQTTVQMLAGPKQLGAAAASVQFSRSIGAAVGTAVVGAVLFAALAASDVDTARLFGTIVERGPEALAGLSAARIAEVQVQIASAFRAAFMTIAVFAACGAALAWSIPVRRITG